MSWLNFLALLAGPAAVGLVMSWIIEYFGAYTALAPKWKRLVFFGVCLVLPLLAAGLGVVTHLYPLTWDTFWQAIVAGATSFSAGTLMHTRKLPDAPGAAE